MNSRLKEIKNKNKFMAIQSKFSFVFFYPLFFFFFIKNARRSDIHYRHTCSKYSFTPHLMMIMTYCYLQSLCFMRRSMITIVITIKAFKVYIWDLYLKSGFMVDHFHCQFSYHSKYQQWLMYFVRW